MAINWRQIEAVMKALTEYDPADPKYAWSDERPREIVVTPLTDAQCRAIVCVPTVGRHGVEYVPDWYGITHHG